LAAATMCKSNGIKNGTPAPKPKGGGGSMKAVGFLVAGGAYYYGAPIVSAALAEPLAKWSALVNPYGESTMAWFTEGGTPHTKTTATKGWPLTDFGSFLAVLIAYTLMVFVLTPIMKMMPGDGIKFPAINFAYNVMQVALCSYMFIESFMIATRNGYSLVCNNMDIGASPPLAKLLWLFYVSKVFDFADTFFIIMGKKWKQLSFLHVYHHMSVFSFYWLNARVNYDGDIYLTIILNGAIHMMMYSYYFLAIHTRDIWWKKYMTTAQLIQFCIMMAQSTKMLYSGAECTNLPPRVTATYLVYILSIFGLFMHFFFQSYASKPKKA